MTDFWVALGMVAPYYNLLLVLVTIYLFLKLFNTPVKSKLVNLKPWKLIFVALLVFVVEEILTILRTAGIINIPIHINGFFELAIISIFIYTLLLQKQYNKQAKMVVAKPAARKKKK